MSGITGIPDAGVFAALKSFQKDQGLTPTGTAKPGDDTVKALNKEFDNKKVENISGARADSRCSGMGPVSKQGNPSSVQKTEELFGNPRGPRISQGCSVYLRALFLYGTRQPILNLHKL